MLATSFLALVLVGQCSSGSCSPMARPQAYSPMIVPAPAAPAYVVSQSPVYYTQVPVTVGPRVYRQKTVFKFRGRGASTCASGACN